MDLTGDDILLWEVVICLLQSLCFGSYNVTGSLTYDLLTWTLGEMNTTSWYTPTSYSFLGWFFSLIDATIKTHNQVDEQLIV